MLFNLKLLKTFTCIIVTEFWHINFYKFKNFLNWLLDNIIHIIYGSHLNYQGKKNWLSKQLWVGVFVGLVCFWGGLLVVKIHKGQCTGLTANSCSEISSTRWSDGLTNTYAPLVQPLWISKLHWFTPGMKAMH